jgi:hypothetical protein
MVLQFPQITSRISLELSSLLRQLLSQFQKIRAPISAGKRASDADFFNHTILQWPQHETRHQQINRIAS